jgi:hypothetical protein
MKPRYDQNLVALVNLCSPYDQLFSSKLNEITSLYSKVFIITDNLILTSNDPAVKFIYSKVRNLNFFPPTREIHPFYKIAIHFDRYCTYFPLTLHIPEFISRLFKNSTLKVLAQISKALESIFKEGGRVVFISEPPASAIGIYCDLLLRSKNMGPYYFTSSRIFSGKSIITQRSDGDADAIFLSSNTLAEDLNSANTNSRMNLIKSTNRGILGKAYRLIRGRSGATSIYPTWLFRILLVWRHFLYVSRSMAIRHAFKQYSIYEARLRFPGKKVVVIYLHFEPEVSTLYWMREVGDQLSWLIEIIKKEKDKLFLIREHVHFKGYRAIADYNKMLSYENVLMGKNEETNSVINEADEILSYSGTIGYECAKKGLFSKFRYGGKPFYADLIDQSGDNISPEKLSEYSKKVFKFESDPAMPEFDTDSNRANFLLMLLRIAMLSRSFIYK